MESLGSRLKEARLEAGLSQAALARKAHLKNQSIIGSLESGYRKNSTHIPAIADALGVEPLWLGEGKGPKRKIALLTTKREKEIYEFNKLLIELGDDDFHQVTGIGQDIARYLLKKQSEGGEEK